MKRGSFEQSRATLALLKILALSNKNVAAGKLRPAATAFAHIRSRVKG